MYPTHTSSYGYSHSYSQPSYPGPYIYPHNPPSSSNHGILTVEVEEDFRTKRTLTFTFTPYLRGHEIINMIQTSLPRPYLSYRGYWVDSSVFLCALGILPGAVLQLRSTCIVQISTQRNTILIANANFEYKTSLDTEIAQILERLELSGRPGFKYATEAFSTVQHHFVYRPRCRNFRFLFTQDSHKFNRDFCLADSIGDVKTSLLQDLMYGQDYDQLHYKLTLNGRRTVESSLVGELNLDEDSLLVLSPVKDSFVYIKNEVGSSFHLMLKPASTIVGQLKEMISDKRDYPPEFQILKLGDEVLQDDELLSDHRVMNGSQVDLSLGRFSLTLTRSASNEAIRFKVKHSDSIQTVKTLVELFFGFKVEDQALFLSKKYKTALIDSTILCEVGLTGKAESLDLRSCDGTKLDKPNSDFLCFYVKRGDDKRTKLHLSRTTTVEALKELFHWLWRIPLKGIQLTFIGYEMEDAATLSECHVENGNAIVLHSLSSLN